MTLYTVLVTCILPRAPGTPRNGRDRMDKDKEEV